MKFNATFKEVSQSNRHFFFKSKKIEEKIIATVTTDNISFLANYIYMTLRTDDYEPCMDTIYSMMNNKENEISFEQRVWQIDYE